MQRSSSLLLLTLCGSCLSMAPAAGDNRLAKDLAKFDLTPGPKVLELGGSDVLADSAPSTGCLRARGGGADMSVLTLVDLELRAGKWVAKSISASDGDLTLTLQSAGPPIGEHTVSGTIAGTAISSFGVGQAPNPNPSHTRISFDATSAQAVDGHGETIGTFVQGHIVGMSSFTDTAGGTSICGRVDWTLQALPPGF